VIVHFVGVDVDATLEPISASYLAAILESPEKMKALKYAYQDAVHNIITGLGNYQISNLWRKGLPLSVTPVASGSMQ
jgi:hypothetical protein